jgi:hypothetical protein
MVHECVENVVHHAEVVVTFVLLFYVRQISSEGIQAGGQ